MKFWRLKRGGLLFAFDCEPEQKCRHHLIEQHAELAWSPWLCHHRRFRKAQQTTSCSTKCWGLRVAGPSEDDPRPLESLGQTLQAHCSGFLLVKKQKQLGGVFASIFWAQCVDSTKSISL